MDEKNVAAAGEAGIRADLYTGFGEFEEKMGGVL